MFNTSVVGQICTYLLQLIARTNKSEPATGKISFQNTVLSVTFGILCFIAIQDAGWLGQKSPPTSVPPVTSTNVGISRNKFPAVSCNPFATLIKNVKAMPSASPRLF